MRWKISDHGHDPRLNDLVADPRAAHLRCRGVAIFRHAFRTAQQSRLHRTQSKRALVKPGRSIARRRSRRLAAAVRHPPADAAFANAVAAEVRSTTWHR